MSGCFNARVVLKGWTPGSGAEPIKIIIGLRSKNAQQKFSTMLLQGKQIVLHGSLENVNEVQLFKDEVQAKVNGSPPLLDVDLRGYGIVVPCPPPKMVLDEAELDKLDDAVDVPDTDLSDVFS